MRRKRSGGIVVVDGRTRFGSNSSKEGSWTSLTPPSRHPSAPPPTSSLLFSDLSSSKGAPCPLLVSSTMSLESKLHAYALSLPNQVSVPSLLLLSRAQRLTLGFPSFRPLTDDGSGRSHQALPSSSSGRYHSFYQQAQ